MQVPTKKNSQSMARVRAWRPGNIWRFLYAACPSRRWRILKRTFSSTTRINQITENDYENSHLVNLEQVSALLRSGSPLSRPPVWLPARLSATPPGSCASRIARKRTRPKRKEKKKKKKDSSWGERILEPGCSSLLGSLPRSR